MTFAAPPLPLRSRLGRALAFLSAFTCSAASVHVRAEWSGEASMWEPWRWNQLESFDGYRIDHAVLAPDQSVWFAHTDGLLRYDGLEIESHRFEGVSKGYVLSMCVADDGSIYAATTSHLLRWVEGEVTEVAKLALKEEDGQVLAKTQSGAVLLTDGADVFEVRPEGLRRLPLDLENPASLLVDAEGNLWVVDYGVKSSVKVYALDLGEQAQAVLLKSISLPDRLDFKPRLFLDSAESVWVLAPDEADTCYKYASGFERSVAITGLKEASLWWETLDVCERSSGEVVFLVRRRMGSWKDGKLDVYDFSDFPIPSSTPYMCLLSDDRLLLGGRDLTPVIVDLSAERWVTYEGLNFQCEDGEGGAWFISRDHEVVRLRDGQWRTFSESEGMIDWATRVVVASDGTVWVSGAHHEHAAVCYLREDRTGERFEFPALGKFFSSLAALETHNGVMIFGNGTPEVSMGRSKGGAVFFQRNGDRYESVHVTPPAFDFRTANLVERQGDGLWFSSGIVSRSPSSGQFFSERVELFEEAGWIDHMIVDRDNDLWIAYLGVGVYRYDGESWYLYGRDEGLTDKNTIFLLEDSQREQILVLTEKGFFRFKEGAWKPWGFRLDESFRRENHTLFQSGDGAIWINFADRSDFVEPDFSNADYHSFHTIRYQPEANPPDTAVRMDRGRIVEGSVVQAFFDGKDCWDQTPQRELEYSWSLDGRTWSPYSRDSFATIQDLRPGAYTLSVRSMDRSGNVDLSPAMASFNVVPVLWKRGWFVGMVLVVTGFVVFLIYMLIQARVKAAVAIEEFKLDFFTNISHELRNPLAVIVAPIDRMLRTLDDGENRHDLRIVLRNVRKMQGMVDQLLEFRKVDKGKWRLNLEDGEVIGFIRDTLLNFEPLLKEKELALQCEAKPESYLCHFDHDVLLKVVDNLVSNAIKYSDAGGSIAVKVEVEEVDSHFELVLRVEDEGRGIPQHELGNVLKPFYRAAGESGASGVGVGLAMVDQLVRLCGGTIQLQSPVPGKARGTRVLVRFPLEPYSDSEESRADEPHEAELGLDLPRVLVVEDNDDFRYLLRKELSDKYLVGECANGKEALEWAARENPDIIVSDVMMPELGGIELCERLKTDPETSHIPVILLTAKSSSDHRVSGISAGADAYIPKPPDMLHLRARIENLLEVRRELKKKFAKQVMVEPTEVTISSTDETILRKAIQIVEENFRNEDFDVAEFAHLMAMSQSSLTRKLKAMMGQTPNRFIQNIRMKRAAKMLATGRYKISEVAGEIGIYDVSYFGKLFRKEFGESPSHYAQEKVEVDL